MFGKLASLFVEIKADTGPLDAGFSRARGLVGEMGGSLARLSAQAAAVFAAAGVAAATLAAAGIVKAVKAAGDLTETLGKIDSVLGDSQGIALRFAEDMAARFGTVRNEALDAVAQIALIGKASGLSQKEAAKLGTSIARLAIDMASLNNSSFEEALQKIKSGMVGEAEPLRAWGVLLSEDAVQAKALAMGLAASAKEAKHLTDAQKVRARVALIAGQTTDSHGDADKTADSFANTMKRLSGNFKNMLADLGAALLPLASRVVSGLGELVGRVAGFMKENIGGFAEAAGKAVDFLAAMAKEAAGMVTQLGEGVGPALKQVALLLGELALAGVRLGIATLKNVLIPVLNGLAKVVGLVAGAMRALVGIFNHLMNLLGINPAVKEVDKLKGAINSLPDASKDAVAKVKADFAKLAGSAADAAKAAGDARQGEIQDMEHADITANALTARERLEQGRGLKPGESGNLRRIQKPGKDAPSEFHDLIGFAKQLQSAIGKKPDEEQHRQTVEIQGVRFEVVNLNTTMRRVERLLEDNTATAG